MKKIYLFLFIVSVFAISANAQVTIGSKDAPAKGAVLELKSDTLGFLPPRVSLKDLNTPNPLSAMVEGMVVYNISTDLPTGLYYNDGSKWIRMVSTALQTKNWFYMPPVVIDTETPSDDVRELDLYAEFKRQKNTKEHTNLVKSAGADDVPFANIPEATDFYYYVIDYDENVFEISAISDAGMMNYKVKGSATDKTFITIIFVEK